MNKIALLDWYAASGVDEAIADTPVDRFAIVAKEKPASTEISSPAIKDKQAPLHYSPSAASNTARTLADSCSSLEELEKAVRSFEGCALKKIATNTVFADGNPKAKLMIIGEAPGAQEDRKGIPFCGPSGDLLNKMLAAIGLERSAVYTSNTIFWRPPGNRQPSKEETLACLPFVEKHIALIKPKLLVLSGGTAATTLLGKDTSISRLRGKLYEYQNPYLDSPIWAAVTYHPSYLLRSPAQKRLAWNDLLLFKKSLKK